MSEKPMITVDGNEACARVAYRVSEVAAIYPITPSSTMGELADEWASKKQLNIWGAVPDVVEMQSEAGAAGAVHGALQAGALGTTFTASQGLLLMIPNMYKIAGELIPFVMHVTARTLATHALSIFGDHSDVMAVRQTGFGMLSSGSVLEAQDLAAISHAATLRSRVPFVHFFDGFRTSHEVSKIESLSDDDLRALVSEELVNEHRRRALSPDHPVLRGSAQNPDTFFQAQEARNPFYDALPGIVQADMDRFAALTGRHYHVFDYVGDPEAEDVVVVMGSGAETVEQTVAWLNRQGRKTGVLKVRLFRPFCVDAFIAALPTTTRNIAVLDRCKEPGAIGEPLYLDVIGALAEAEASGRRPAGVRPRVIGGRYGLASKEFTPAMVLAVFDELQAARPKPHFTVGIIDDVTGLSLPTDETFTVHDAGERGAVFFGLGADGTVGANKNSIKIIADHTPLYAQGYFVYDSKKSGAVTISHLRFSPNPIKAPYLLRDAGFLACHHFVFLSRYDVMQYAAPGGTFLLNTTYSADEVWDHLPHSTQMAIHDKGLKFYVIDAGQVAQAAGMGGRINTVMQTCFFAISGVLPQDEAIGYIKKSIEKTYGRKSADMVKRNFEAVEMTLAHLHQVRVPAMVTSPEDHVAQVPASAPDFVRRVTAMMLEGKGDLLPVSAMPVDGTWPVGTAKYEKRNIADEIPTWDPSLCIQCNKCVLICPHAAIRAKSVSPDTLVGAPATLKSMPYKASDFKGTSYLLQVAPEDCTGCTLCVKVCPGKDKADASRLSLTMQPKQPLLDAERSNFDFFLALPEMERTQVLPTAKGIGFLQPLFEFSGACLGCGETPYIRMLTQLFGDRALMANATGCSSIFGGNLPTTPYTMDTHGRGPAWANSLFEDNAEFGLGFRVAVDQHTGQARGLLSLLSSSLPERLVSELLQAKQDTEIAIAAQRARVSELRSLLAGRTDALSLRLTEMAEFLVDKVVWIVGGDGWAYDIGFGGFDHVLASGRNVNVMVLDTEVYSNTGGQASKSTPIGATAKFASAGKSRGKKDLGMMAMSYGNVYVASVAYGAKDVQAVRALSEAAAYKGPSLVIGYAHCIAHGLEMATGLDHQKNAVRSGYWPLYRYDPRKVGTAEPALQLDSEVGDLSVADFMKSETRFRMTASHDAAVYNHLVDEAAEHIRTRNDMLKEIASGASVI